MKASDFLDGSASVAPKAAAPISASAFLDGSGPSETDSWVTLGRKAIENGFTGFKQQIGAALQQAATAEPAPPMSAGVRPGEIEALAPDPVARGFSDTKAAISSAADTPGTPAHLGKTIYQSAAADIKANAPNVDPVSVKNYAYMAAEALVQMAPSIAAGVVAKSSIPTLGLMYAQQSAQQYGQARNESGRTQEQAQRDAAFYGLAETIPEQIPLGILMKPGRKFLPKLLKVAGAEGLQEMFTQVLETGYDKATISPDMTWGEAWRQVRDAGIVGAVVGGGMHTATHPFTKNGVPPQDQEGGAGSDQGPPGGEGPSGGGQSAAPRLASPPGPQITPEDIKPGDEQSPIPTDLIAAGRAKIRESAQGGTQPSTEAAPSPVEEPAAAPSQAIPPAVDTAETPVAQPATEQAQPAAESAWEPLYDTDSENQIGWHNRLTGDVRGLENAPETQAQTSQSQSPQITPEKVTSQPGSASALPSAAQFLEAGTDARPSPDVTPTPQAEPTTETTANPAKVGTGEQAALAKPLLRTNGTPFASEKSALAAARQRPDLNTRNLKPVPVKGGWALHETPQEVSQNPYRELAHNAQKILDDDAAGKSYPGLSAQGRADLEQKHSQYASAADQYEKQRVVGVNNSVAGNAKPQENFNPVDYARRLQARVRNTRASLAPEAIAKDFGISTEQALRALSHLAANREGGVVIGPKGVRRAPISKGPIDVATFIARTGGVRNNEGHDLIKGRGLQRFIPGAGPMIRPGGKSVDALGEALWEAGYFGPTDATARPTENDVLQLIERTAGGQKIYSPEDAAAVDEARASARAQEDEDAARSDIAGIASGMNEQFSANEIDEIVGLMGGGMDAQNAVVEYVERQAIRTADDIAEETGNPDHADIPFDTQSEPQGSDREAGTRQQRPEGEQKNADGSGAPGTDASQTAGNIQSEPGAEGLPQTIIPGAEQSARQLAQAREVSGHGKAKAKVPQKDVGGLFAQDEPQSADLFDNPPDTQPKTIRASDSIERAAIRRAALGTEDAGEKIGGARKDQWAERGLRASDLEGMSQGEAYQYVTKDAVWPKPDYAKMVADGTDPEVAAIIKIIRDRLAARPREDSARGRVDYIEMMRHIRDEFAGVRTRAQLSDARGNILYNRLGWDRNGSSLTSSKELRDRLFSVVKGRREAIGVQYGDTQKAAKMIGDGFPDEIAPWRRKFDVRETGSDNYAITPKGKWRPVESGFETQAEAEARAKDIYEETKSSTDSAALPTRPHLDAIERTGEDVRGGRNVDSQNFINDFGFRGVEFGNWVASDERQKSINMAYDALHDMARVIGVPPKALSLDGTLGLAFGARGSGRAAAHYEPGKLVINLTKLSGAGSLAHEWGHALDHYFGMLDRPASSKGATRGASGWYGRIQPHEWNRHVENLRPEMQESFYNLIGALFRKDKDRATAVRDTELALEAAQGNKEKYAKQLSDHEDQPAQKQNAAWAKQMRDYLAHQDRRITILKGALSDLRDEAKPYTPSKTESSYYKSAKALSGKSGEKGYWARPTELFARAFESYVFDKIKADGNRSDYLVQGVEPERYERGYKGNPYPAGPERTAINSAFDHLFETMDTREGASGPALFARRTDGNQPVIAGPNARFEGKIALAFSPEFRKARADVAKRLRERLDGLGLKKIAVRVADRILMADPDGNAPIDGYYQRKLITIALDSASPDFTLDHEAIHAMRSLGLFTDAEWRILSIESRKTWVPRYDVKNRYVENNAEKNAEEGVAFAFMDWRAERGQQSGFAKRIFQRVRDILDALRNVLAGNGFDTVERIFARVESGAVGSRAQGETPASAPRFSRQEAVAERSAAQTGADARISFARRAPTDGPPGPFDRMAIEPSTSVVDHLLDSSRSLTDRLRSGASREVISESIDRWRTGFQDRYLPLLRAQEAVEKQLGTHLAEEQNPYLAEELSTGRKGAKLEDLSETMVRPLFDAMAQRKVSLDELEAYLYARHAPERNARIAEINPEFGEGEGSGMTDDEAAEIMKAVKTSGKEQDLMALAGIVDNIRDLGVKERIDSGLLSQEQSDAWRQTYKHYVPLRGRAELDPEMDTARPRHGSGINIRGDESRRAFGRKTPARDLVAYSIMQAEEAIVRAETNRVARAFYDLAKSAPNADFWSTDKITERPTWDKAKGQVVYRAENRITADDKDYTISLKIDGVEHRVTLNRDNPNAVRLAAAMRNLNGEKLGGIVHLLGTVNRWLSSVNTTRNPEFVVTNAFRDLQTAAINLNQYEIDGLIKNTIRDYPGALKGAMLGSFGKEGGEWTKWYNEFRQAGGRVYFNRVENVAEIRRRINRDVSRLSQGKSAKTVIGHVSDFIENVNLGVENAIRLSAYKNAREAGMSQAKAASLAKNLTVNFNRRGAWGPLMNTAYLFYNASVQGTAVMLGAMKNPRVRRVIYGVIITGALLDLLNSMISGTDDDGERFYDKLSAYDKQHNLIVMNPLAGTGAGSETLINVRLPLPYGYNVFYALGRDTMAALRGRGVWNSFADIATTAIDSFNPVGGAGSILNLLSPTIFDPVVDLAQNRDYAGRPIMPDQPQYGPKKPEHTRYWNSVSPQAKAITDFLNSVTGGDDVVPGSIDVSPEVLDYMFGQVTGAAGAFYSRTAALIPKLADPTSQVTWNDIPLARKVIGGNPSWYNKEMFYRRTDAIESTYAAVRNYAKAGDAAKARAYLLSHADMVKLRNAGRRTRKTLANIRHARSRAVFDREKGAISTGAYNARIITLKKLEDGAITNFNRAYIAAGNPSNPD